MKTPVNMGEQTTIHFPTYNTDLSFMKLFRGTGTYTCMCSALFYCVTLIITVQNLREYRHINLHFRKLLSSSEYCSLTMGIIGKAQYL